MEHIISQILDIEKHARQLVSEAEADSGRLQGDVDAHLAAFREHCLDRARTHIEAIRKTEHDDTEASLDRLTSEYAQKSAELEEWESRNFDRWLDELLNKVRY